MRIKSHHAVGNKEVVVSLKYQIVMAKSFQIKCISTYVLINPQVDSVSLILIRKILAMNLTGIQTLK